MSSESANEYMINFKYFISQADKHEHFSYEKNPFKHFKKDKKKNIHRVMTSKEVKAFFDYVPEDDTYLHVQNGFGLMLYLAGIRISDLLNLKWENFRVIGKSYYIEYCMQKTRKMMIPKLTLEALEFLIPFIEEYDKGLTKSYIFLKKNQDVIIKERRICKEGLEEHELISLSDLKHAAGSDFDSFLALGIQREKKEIYLKNKISELEKSKDLNKILQIECIAEACLKLKISHPTETILPHCRFIPMEEIKRVQHAVKVHFNHRLKMIQKKMKIQTSITNHMARHVFAQRLFESGANHHFISLALGHASLKITENYREQLITDEAM